MELLKKLKNKELLLYVIDDEGNRIGPVYTTNIISVIDSNNLIISAPSFENCIVPLPVDTGIRIIFGGFYNKEASLKGVIADRQNNSNFVILQTRVYDTFDENKQRRLFYRVECSLDAEYRVHTHNKNKDELFEVNLGYKHAQVINISQGGVCLEVKENIEEDSLLEVRIWIEDKPIDALCKVVRKTKTILEYKLRLSFEKISDKNRDIVIKYVFEKQQ